ncbi:MAG: DUF805 domain-containing protein [Methylococcaceae bacterium]|nr:DUF805 domain-containing protein [Methylococcaceae bacterium]
MNNRKITIGRSTDCDLVLADLTVSRQHAELELLENGRLLLTDCHSSQGTFVIRGGHEEKIKQQVVSKHDLLMFGNITIPVSEILTATHLYNHDSPVVEVEKLAQKAKSPGSMKLDLNKNPQPENNIEATDSLSKLFLSFDGRISRSTYWLKYMLPYSVIYVVLTPLDMVTGSFDPTIGYGTFSGIFVLVGLIPSLTMGIKRCHDRGRTGWFLLISLIPLINIWVLIELWFLKGTDGINKYGPDPLL